MLRTLILSAAAAGVAAGLFTAVVQHVTTTPIILEAEKYENNAGGNDHAGGHDHGTAASVATDASQPANGAAMQAAPAEEEEWKPADGIQRTLYTEFREGGFAPAPLLEHLVTAGYFGRKAGRGFRDYGKG